MSSARTSISEMQNRHYIHLTNAFNKKFEIRAFSVAIALFCHNFVRIHQRLRSAWEPKGWSFASFAVEVDAFLASSRHKAWERRAGVIDLGVLLVSGNQGLDGGGGCGKIRASKRLLRTVENMSNLPVEKRASPRGGVGCAARTPGLFYSSLTAPLRGDAFFARRHAGGAGRYQNDCVTAPGVCKSLAR